MRLISKNRPSHSLGEVIRSARRARARAFEETFAKKMQAPFAVAFPYCRVAIEALLEVAARPNSTVIVPAYTCSVVAHAVLKANMTPRFVDIQESDFNTPVADLLANVDATTSAIIPTHMYGMPVDLDPLEHYNSPLLVIEDGSLGMHPAWKSNNPNLTVATVYSFGSNKIISTVRGGIVVTHNADLAQKLRQWRDEKLHQPTFRDRLTLLIELAALTFAFSEVPYSVIDRLRNTSLLRNHLDTRSLSEASFPSNADFTFSGVQAALGLSQLSQIDSFIARRQAIAERYTQALSSVPGIIPMNLVSNSHYSHYALRVPNRDSRHFREKLRATGIESGATFDYLVPELPLYKSYAHTNFPVGSRIVRELVNLPNYPALTDQQVERIITAVQSI